MVILPDNMPGHWETMDGADIARRSATETRAKLSFGGLSDFALANSVFLTNRNDPKLLLMLTAAKERIRWLSVQLAIANQANAAAMSVLADPRISTHDHDCREMIEKREKAVEALLTAGAEQPINKGNSI